MNAVDLSHGQKANSKTIEERECHFLPQALMLLGLVSLVSAAMPELDLIVGRFFWEHATGFEFTENSFLIAFRDTNRFLPWVVVGTAIALLIPNPFLRHLKDPPSPHKLLCALTFFAAGPGLGVHLIKMFLVERVQKHLMNGGSTLFTPPWDSPNNASGIAPSSRERRQAPSHC
jgi:hypothetical protein